MGSQSRILLIASYGGDRRWSLPSSELLSAQHRQLAKLKHNLDKIVVIHNDSPRPEELSLFENVIYRENRGASYGAWIEGFRQNPDFDWYFLLEDDYVYVHDHFDQLMIDEWDDETSYLCSLIDDRGFGRHAAISNGLVSGEAFAATDFGILEHYPEAYGATLQVGFGSYLDTSIPGKHMRDMSGKYGHPFWQEGLRYVGEELPILIAPVQWLKEKECPSG